MQQYKVRKNGFDEIRKKVLLRTIPLVLPAAGVGIYVSRMNQQNGDNSLSTNLLIVGVMAVVGPLSLLYAVKKQKAPFESVVLTVEDDRISREQMNLAPLTLRYTDIKEIIRTAGRGLLIKGHNAADMIVIPAQIENYDELERILDTIVPIKEHTSLPLWQRYGAWAVLPMLGLMLCAFTVTNKIVMCVSSLILAAVLVWSYIKIQQNKNISVDIKRKANWIWLVLFSVIGSMIVKLMAH